MEDKESVFDRMWAKLASLPQNQQNCYIEKSNGAVRFCCEKFPWYGKNEEECLEFLKGN